MSLKQNLKGLCTPQMSQIFYKSLASIFKSNSFIFPSWIIYLKYLDVKLFTSCFNYVVHFKTDAFLIWERELFLAHSFGYAINKSYMYTSKFNMYDVIDIVSTVVKTGIRYVIQRPKIKLTSPLCTFFFFSFSFFDTFILMFLVSWACPLHKIQYSWLFSHNKIITKHWPTWDQQWLQFPEKIYCFRRLQICGIAPAEFLSCSLP